MPELGFLEDLREEVPREGSIGGDIDGEVLQDLREVDEVLEIAVANREIELLHDTVFMDDLTHNTDSVLANRFQHLFHEVLTQIDLR